MFRSNNIRIISRLQSTLVAGEISNGALSAATRSALHAASLLKLKTTLLLVGSIQPDQKATKEAALACDSLLVLTHPKLNISEHLASAIAQITRKNKYSHIVSASTTNSQSYIPRLAALLDVECVSEVVKINSDREFVRPCYAGNALATVKSTDNIVILTVRTTAFPPLAVEGNKEAVIETAEYEEDASVRTLWVGQQLVKSDRPELAASKIVVSGGRGMKSGENFEMLYALAEALGGGAVGASRAAVDAGFVPNSLQIGQTGKIIAPALYIGVGVSGAIQHLAGMKDSKTIVAINKDPEAPIFTVADYGLVADLFDAVPEMTKKLKAINK